MYRWIGFDVSSASKNNIWATVSAESVSLIFGYGSENSQTFKANLLGRKA